MPILTNEALNYCPEVPPILYHYCSMQSFLSIIENKNIWLSDASKTNDKTELIWIFDKILQVIDNVLKKHSNELPREAIKETKMTANTLIHNFVENLAPIVQEAKNLLVCFSEEKDLLSQWRAYANNGQGVAIGFDASFLETFASSTSHGFTKVIYDEKDIETFLYYGMENRLVNAIKANIDKNGNIINEIDLKIDIGIIIYAIYQEGFVFKHKSFSEENEWRILKRFTSSNFNDSDGVDDYGYSEMLDGIFRSNDNFTKSFSRSELKFRCVDNDIRTYMELGFDNIKTEFIKEIIIGPKCEVNELDIRLLLAKNGYIEDYKSDKIKIIHSNAPYK